MPRPDPAAVPPGLRCAAGAAGAFPFRRRSSHLDTALGWTKKQGAPGSLVGTVSAAAPRTSRGPRSPLRADRAVLLSRRARCRPVQPAHRAAAHPGPAAGAGRVGDRGQAGSAAAHAARADRRRDPHRRADLHPVRRRHAHRRAPVPRRGRVRSPSWASPARSSPPPAERRCCTTPSASTGSPPCWSPPRSPRPIPPSCSRCSASARSPGAAGRSSRASPARTTRSASR